MSTLIQEKKNAETADSTDRQISGSEAVLLGLIAEQTEVIFGYPGGAIMPIYDALYHFNDRLEHILVRHEQGAIHAAQGYARSSGQYSRNLTGVSDLIIPFGDWRSDVDHICFLEGICT